MRDYFLVKKVPLEYKWNNIPSSPEEKYFDVRLVSLNKMRKLK